MWVHAFTTTDGVVVRISVNQIVSMRELDAGVVVRLSNGDEVQVTKTSYGEFLTELDTRSQF
jgi:hypothetical protein